MSNLQILDVTKLYPPVNQRLIKYRSLDKIKFLMIHHSGGEKLNLADLYKLHTAGLHKWNSIGYHFFVSKNKVIYKVNNIDQVVNGCENHNTNTVHICFEGNYSNEITYLYHKHSIEYILFKLKELGLNPEIISHSERKNTECCGKNLIKVISDIKASRKKDNGFIWPEFEY